MNDKTAKWYLVGVLVVTIVIDIILDAQGHTTISKFLLGVIQEHPWSPIGLIIFGTVLGHLFWPQKIKK